MRLILYTSVRKQSFDICLPEHKELLENYKRILDECDFQPIDETEDSIYYVFETRREFLFAKNILNLFLSKLKGKTS